MKTRILILTSSTGGGHNMRADAFKAWSEHPKAEYLEIEVGIFYTLDSMHPIYSFGVELYNWIQRFMPRLHHVYYNYLELFPSCRYSKTILGKDKLISVVNCFLPHIVLSVHDHLNHGFFDIIYNLLKGRVRCVTYCGELSGGYGFSKHWVNPNCDLFIGATKETCRKAEELGMSGEKCWNGGFMTKPKFEEQFFCDKNCREWIISELKFDPERFILLLATGANGANCHISLLNKIKNMKNPPQLIALCGNNHNSKSEIINWKKRNSSIPIAIYGYTDQMPRFLKISSAVVLRPGTGTTSEAMLSNCPIIFNGIGGIMPQERITVNFSRRYNFGNIIHKSNDLIDVLSLLMTMPEEITKERNRMALSLPNTNSLEILNKLKLLQYNA